MSPWSDALFLHFHMMLIMQNPTKDPDGAADATPLQEAT